MHIDHEQLLQLLADTTGIEPEKITQQLNDLIKEITDSVKEGEAYEIEGFGIFSGIGNRVMFIPSKELETEVNFKYVGMEPIELEDGSSKSAGNDPFEGLQMEPEEEPKKSDPFTGLVEEDVLKEASKKRKKPLFEEPEEEEETPGPDKWGVSAHKEDESADRLFASLMGEKYTPPLKDEEGIEAESDIDPFEDVFGEEETDTDFEKTTDSSLDLGAELAQLMSDSDSSTPMKEDDFEEDIFDDDEETEDPFAEVDEESEIPEIELEESILYKTEDETFDDDPFGEVINEDKEETAVDENEEESATEFALEKHPEHLIDAGVDELGQDFDDPFGELEDPKTSSDNGDEIIPVITNISSGVVGGKEETADEAPEKIAKKLKKESEPAPAWLWVVLILVIVGGGIFGLGYFNMVTIPFITPDSANQTTTSTQPPVVAQQNPVNPIEPTPATKEPSEAESPSAEVSQSKEQTPTQIVENSQSLNQPMADEGTNATLYGLEGAPTEAANDGFTIVLYSLSNRESALQQQQNFTSKGYRTLVKEIPNAQYGTLYRVSVGQFASLFDAADAAETINGEIPDNYFIKKIN